VSTCWLGSKHPRRAYCTLYGTVEAADAYERLTEFLDEIRGEIEQQAEERLAQWAAEEAGS
jgi:hypothetical protein